MLWQIFFFFPWVRMETLLTKARLFCFLNIVCCLRKDTL